MTPILAGPAEDDRPHRDILLLPPELRGGDATQFAYRINNLQIQDGEQIQLANPGVTAIVGATTLGSPPFCDRSTRCQPSSLVCRSSHRHRTC